MTREKKIDFSSESNQLVMIKDAARIISVLRNKPVKLHFQHQYLKFKSSTLSLLYPLPQHTTLPNPWPR